MFTGHWSLYASVARCHCKRVPHHKLSRFFLPDPYRMRLSVALYLTKTSHCLINSLCNNSRTVITRFVSHTFLAQVNEFSGVVENVLFLTGIFNEVSKNHNKPSGVVSQIYLFIPNTRVSLSA